MKKIVLFILFIILFQVSFAQQQDSVTEKRLSRLENILSKLPKISGMLDFRYQYNKNTSTFDIRRARLDFKGELGKMFDYRVQIELASSPFLLDAYTRIKIKPYFNLQVGVFKLPFTMENPYSPKNLELIDNALSVLRLCSFSDLSGIKSNGRDLGIMAYGSFLKRNDKYIFEYALGVFNGAGINVKDNNKSKDVVARVYIHPFRHFTISVSGYVGEMVKDETHKYERRDRYGLGGRYDNDKLFVRSEFIGGNTAGMRTAGGYVTLGYHFKIGLTPVLRFDIIQDDILALETRQIDYTAGLSYWINKYFRCQVNYSYQTFLDKKKRGSYVAAVLTTVF